MKLMIFLEKLSLARNKDEKGKNINPNNKKMYSRRTKIDNRNYIMRFKSKYVS